MNSMYSRTELLIGPQGIEKLKRSRVIIFGLGGVGSFALEGLVRAGVGSLTLVDFDVVEMSNLNRQLLAMHSTLGEPKVEAARRRVLDINPLAQVTVHQTRCSEQNCRELLAPGFDYAVDAIDMVSAKVALICEARRSGLPIVSSMGAGNKLDPTAFRVGDISETRICPLARAVRRRLRQEGIVSGVKAVYSLEPPGKTVEGGRLPGSISFVPSVAGLVIAGVVIKDLLKNLES